MATDKTPRRLGRGLEALLGAGTRPRRDEPAVQDLSISEIRSNPLQPRREFRDEELAELADSMRTSGLLQPVTVRLNPSGRGYQLIAGERRWRAAQSLGWKTIPAAVRDVDDQTILALALVENLQRTDLNPLEEALGYRQLLDFGGTQQTVAKLVGKSRSAVANTLRLLELPTRVQTMVRTGELSAGQVRPLLSLGDAAAITRLAEEVRDKKLPARAVEKRASQRSKAGKPRRPSRADRKDPHVRALEDDLRRYLQTDVKVATRRGGGGEISIRFYSAEDLERVLDRIGIPPQS